MPEIGEGNVQTINYSTWREKKKGSWLCSFLGRHASIFTLAGSVRCLCLTETVSPHRVPVGSTPAMTGGRAMGERQQKKSDSRWQRQHKHLRVRTPPWKESEGCLFSGAAQGCPLWDSQADGQKGEQTADHTAELRSEGSQVINVLIHVIMEKWLLCNLKHYLYSSACQVANILNLDECPIAVESVPLWFKDLFQWAIAGRD